MPTIRPTKQPLPSYFSTVVLRTHTVSPGVAPAEPIQVDAPVQQVVPVSRRNAIATTGNQRTARPSRCARTIHPLSVADLQRRQNGVVVDRIGVEDSSTPAPGDSAPSSRRSSNDVSIRDFLKVSKISMVRRPLG